MAGLSCDGIIDKATNAISYAVDKGADSIKNGSSTAVETAKEAADAANDIA